MGNPVYQKEWKVTVRTMRITWELFLFNALLAVVGLCMLQMYFYNSAEVEYIAILRIFYRIEWIELVLLGLIVPTMTAGSIAGEREKQTLEILLSTTLPAFHIVIGKLAAVIATAGTFFISSLPILSLVFLIGVITPTALLQFLLYGFVFSIFVGSIGMFFSVLTKKTIVANLCTFGTVLLLNGLPLLVNWISYLSQLHTRRFIQSGKIIVLGLLDPAFTAVGMVASQVGEEKMYQNICLMDMNKDSIWVQQVSSFEWFCYSNVVQIIVSVLLLVAAAILLRKRK